MAVDVEPIAGCGGPLAIFSDRCSRSVGVGGGDDRRLEFRELVGELGGRGEKPQGGGRSRRPAAGG